MRRMKNVLIGLAFAGIVGSLASALVFMMKGGQPGEGDEAARASRMVKALALRVGLSILLFVCILAAWKLGWVQPSGLPAKP
ncbi:MAG: twin transmembrane helix small protein [Pseudomonadota bacterium]|nr:twin transmembrane helix small protein [Pseudomonadota bacterium]